MQSGRISHPQPRWAVPAHASGEGAVRFSGESSSQKPTACVRAGLTSSIACGKSTVLKQIQQLGVPTFDIDKAVHTLWATDTELLEKTRQLFGPGVFGEDGKIDRKKLGEIAFSDPEKLKTLESWIHPKVRQMMFRFFEDNAQAKLAVAEIPLLFESKMENLFDLIVVVKASLDQQIQRLMSRNSLTREQALARIQKQMPVEEKVQRAEALGGVIIDNSGSVEETEAQVRQWVSRYQVLA